MLRVHLNAAQIALFRRMCAAEQRHALAVLRTLQEDRRPRLSPRGMFLAHDAARTEAGDVHSDERQLTGGDSVKAMVSAPALMQAALLHDVGKVGGHIRLWHRVAAVLLQALHPALLHRLALDEPGSWRYPFFALLHHAERGADLSAGAGTDALAVALIRAHHTAPEQSGLDAPGQALLLALQAADEDN